MEDGDPAGVGPAATDLNGDLIELATALFLVGLVGERAHALPTIGMVAHRSAEQDHRTAVGTNRPVIDGTDREFLGGEGNPRLTLTRLQHAVQRSPLPTRRLGRPGRSTSVLKPVALDC